MAAFVASAKVCFPAANRGAALTAAIGMTRHRGAGGAGVHSSGANSPFRSLAGKGGFIAVADIREVVKAAHLKAIAALAKRYAESSELLSFDNRRYLVKWTAGIRY